MSFFDVFGPDQARGIGKITESPKDPVYALTLGDLAMQNARMCQNTYRPSFEDRMLELAQEVRAKHYELQQRYDADFLVLLSAAVLETKEIEMTNGTIAGLPFVVSSLVPKDKKFWMVIL